MKWTILKFVSLTNSVLTKIFFLINIFILNIISTHLINHQTNKISLIVLLLIKRIVEMLQIANNLDVSMSHNFNTEYLFSNS
ncbi:hypothetical protein QTP88_005108 [Uroleucon formosanum]